jgi:hypothetical protein
MKYMTGWCFHLQNAENILLIQSVWTEHLYIPITEDGHKKVQFRQVSLC